MTTQTSSSNVARFRPPVDWEAIERDYRTGRFSLRQLAAMHKRSAAQISRHAQKHGWAKDLAPLLRHATSAAIIADLAGEVTEAQRDTTAVILAAAEVQKNVILAHRHEIQRARAVLTNMLAELEIATNHREQLNRLLAAAVDGLDEAAAAALRQALHRLTGLHARASSLHKLADAMSKLQAIERRAFGITDDDRESDPLEHYTDDDLLREAARLRERVGNVVSLARPA